MKRITQSFYKDMLEYIDGGSCGHLMKKKWIDDELIELDSDNIALGAYFEYIFTELMLGPGNGSLPKNGQIPRAEYYAKSLKVIADLVAKKLKGGAGSVVINPWDKNELGQSILGVDDMLAPYKLAHQNAEALASYFKLMGIEIVKAGKPLVKGRLEGTIDLIVKWEGELRVIDLKYSGLINERWSKFGWAWTEEQKKYHGIQAKHYHHITGMPFYFWVVSSKNENEQKIFKITFSNGEIDKHVDEAIYLEKKLKYYDELGWIARPEIAKCKQCPLVNSCQDKATHPIPEEIIL